MKNEQKNIAQSLVREDTPFMKTFASQEDAERYQMIMNIEKSDMEKFRDFCRMLRIGRMLSSANIINNE